MKRERERERVREHVQIRQARKRDRRVRNAIAKRRRGLHRQRQIYANTKKQASKSAQPTAPVVQLSKRRQSAESPVGDGADLVVAQAPAPPKHCVRKCT
jgi:hypothetical protein